MGTISFHQTAHSLDVHVQMGASFYVAHFNDAAQAISFAATQTHLVSGEQAQKLLTSERPFSIAIRTVPEAELLVMGFRKVS